MASRLRPRRSRLEIDSFLARFHLPIREHDRVAMAAVRGLYGTRSAENGRMHVGVRYASGRILSLSERMYRDREYEPPIAELPTKEAFETAQDTASGRGCAVAQFSKAPSWSSY